MRNGFILQESAVRIIFYQVRKSLIGHAKTKTSS